MRTTNVPLCIILNSPLFMPKLFNTLEISKEAKDEWLITLSTGNDIGIDPQRLILSIFLLHWVRNLFPPQALHPLANGLLFLIIILLRQGSAYQKQSP